MHSTMEHIIQSSVIMESRLGRFMEPCTRQDRHDWENLHAIVLSPCKSVSSALTLTLFVHYNGVDVPTVDNLHHLTTPDVFHQHSSKTLYDAYPSFGVHEVTYMDLVRYRNRVSPGAHKLTIWYVYRPIQQRIRSLINAHYDHVSRSPGGAAELESSTERVFPILLKDFHRHDTHETYRCDLGMDILNVHVDCDAGFGFHATPDFDLILLRHDCLQKKETLDLIYRYTGLHLESGIYECNRTKTQGFFDYDRMVLPYEHVKVAMDALVEKDRQYHVHFYGK